MDSSRAMLLENIFIVVHLQNLLGIKSVKSNDDLSKIYLVKSAGMGEPIR